jgi:nucleoside-diphosphate-sugar epimerase
LAGAPKSIDFRRQSHVEEWMALHRPRVMFLTAGRVGRIHANDTFPADFLYDNLFIEANIIHAAYRTGVEKLRAMLVLVQVSATKTSRSGALRP